MVNSVDAQPVLKTLVTKESDPCHEEWLRLARGHSPSWATVSAKWAMLPRLCITIHSIGLLKSSKSSTRTSTTHLSTWSQANTWLKITLNSKESRSLCEQIPSCWVGLLVAIQVKYSTLSTALLGLRSQNRRGSSRITSYGRTWQKINGTKFSTIKR